MSLAVMLSLKAHDEASVVFSVIFVIVWVGAAVITINGQLLGGRLCVKRIRFFFLERAFQFATSASNCHVTFLRTMYRRSFFQSVCLLGYCIFPVLLSAVACFLINSLVKNDFAVVFRFVSVLVALLWSIWGKSTTSRLRNAVFLFPMIDGMQGLCVPPAVFD